MGFISQFVAASKDTCCKMELLDAYPRKGELIEENNKELMRIAGFCVQIDIRKNEKSAKLSELKGRYANDDPPPEMRLLEIELVQLEIQGDAVMKMIIAEIISNNPFFAESHHFGLARAGLFAFKKEDKDSPSGLMILYERK